LGATTKNQEKAKLVIRNRREKDTDENEKSQMTRDLRLK